ncbi:hypothetical protein [Mesoplasma florum]|uniref:hypothetical protein n=1 Tax=Mesoplasma florum TaxID=2151 RepID=UPI000D035A3D|nr:hypothetical protein [Mesoplasma florum]AVN59118.1 hypothetical protein CG009_02710 [Mesoplasma florum]
MKKTITLLAAVSIVGGTSATAVSCSFKGDKNKGGTTDPKTTDKESNQVLLKMEVQNYLNEKGTFDSKESAIKDIQSKSDWKTEGIDSLTGSIYGTDSVSSIHIKGKLKKGYIWPRTSAGEFDVTIKINNEKNVEKVATELSTIYFEDENEAKENIKTKFKLISGVDQVSVIQAPMTRSRLKYEVNLTYKNNVEGPEKQEVLINLKNNLSTDIYAANQSISKDNKKYESKPAAAKFIKSTFESIEGVQSTSLVWDQWAPYNYTISIKYDDKSKGPENAEGVIQLKSNLADAIKTAQNIFESKEYKSSSSARTTIESSLKIEGITITDFSLVDDESLLKYNVKLSYSNDYFGPTSISGKLSKYQSAKFDKIEDQTIDMRKTNTILVDLKGNNLANKKISVSSSDNTLVSATYANEKITLRVSDNKNIKAVIKVWDEEEKEDGIEFTAWVLAKPEIVTKLEPEYGWYLNHETTLDIFTNDFDKTKGDSFEITSKLQGVQNSFSVSTYIETSLLQDSQNQQKFILHYKFINALPENAKVQIGLKLNDEIVSTFTLVTKAETNISDTINKTLNDIKNNFNYKVGKESDLEIQVESDLKSINGIEKVYFDWTSKPELTYKVTVFYKLGFTGDKSFINKGTRYEPAKFENAEDIIYDLRKPSNNTYKIYGKNLTGKSLAINSDNNETKVSIARETGIEENGLEFRTITVDSNSIDDTAVHLKIYQVDDTDQNVEINLTIFALPYQSQPNIDWPITGPWALWGDLGRLEIAKNSTKNLNVHINNFHPELGDTVEIKNDKIENISANYSVMKNNDGKATIILSMKWEKSQWWTSFANIELIINGQLNPDGQKRYNILYARAL